MRLPAAGRFQPGKDTDFGCFLGKGKKRFREWVVRAKRAPKKGVCYKCFFSMTALKIDMKI